MKKRDLFLSKAHAQVQEALRSKDMLIAHTSKGIEDLNQVIHLLHERLETMYDLYFPELKAKEPEKYVQLVAFIDRKDLDMNELSKKVGHEKAKQIAEKAANTMGVDFDPEDLRACQMLAAQILSLHSLVDNYRKYQEMLATRLCPNTTFLAGADIAARLVARVGSLSKLAILPASTIQVLGAEKALFKHLRNRRIAPPKHGILFQHLYISNSPKRVRGKIARALANKIATALKADAFTKNFIAEKLKKDFEARYQAVMEEYKKSRTDKPKI